MAKIRAVSTPAEVAIPRKYHLASATPDQDTPADMVARLLAYIRGQFCGDMDDKKWFSLRAWFQQYVVLWPAQFMKGKGFTLPAARYEEILRSVFDDIKRHGTTGVVKHWNGYLLKCVQDHFAHHWEDYYREAKAVRQIAERALLACKKVEPEDRTVDHLAAAQAVLSGKTRRQKAKPAAQMTLFKL